jgi:hypothetical protein
MYVPGLKKNLVSVSMLEDRGYDVIFSKGKAFLHHIASGQVKQDQGSSEEPLQIGCRRLLL